MTYCVATLLVMTATSMPCAAAPNAVSPQSDGGPRTPVLNTSRLVSNDELSEMRGGFFTAAGAQFDFGASVQTLVNGELALQTNVQWTSAGAVTQQLTGLGTHIKEQVANTVAANLANAGIATIGGGVQSSATNSPATTGIQSSSMPATDTAKSVAPSAPVSGPALLSAPAAGSVTNAPVSAPATAGAPTVGVSAPVGPSAASVIAGAPLNASGNTGANAPAGNSASTVGVSAPVGPSAASVIAAAPLNASGNTEAHAPAGNSAPTILTGMEIPGATGGSTQVFANIGSGQIQNVIVNSASGQDITQNTNIALTIYNFAPWQQQLTQNMLSARLANDMMAASGLSLGH